MIRKTSRIAISLMLLLSLIGSVVACGSNDSSSTTTTAVSTVSTATEPVKKAPVTFTLATFNGWGTNDPILKTAIKEYKEFSGNTVELQLFPDDQFLNVIRTKLASGDATDLVDIAADQTTIPTTYYEPLDGPWAASLNPLMAAKVTRASDKKITTAPYSAMSYLGAIYNKEVFAKAGVKPVLKTYNDLIAACEAIKKIGVAPIQIANKDQAGHLWQYIGSSYLFKNESDLAANIMSNKVKPQDDAGMVELFERTLSLKKYLKSDYASATGMDALKQVATGEVAMFANGSWCYGILQKDFSDKLPNIGIMPITLGDDSISVTQTLGGCGFSIPTTSKHKVEAAEFINWFLQPEKIKEWSQWSPGTWPYNGVDTEKSPWDDEMSGYVDQGLTTDLGLEGQFPNFDFVKNDGYALSIQSMFVGKPVKDTLEAWYKGMSDVNKSKRTTGW
ncbi:MAG TPA: ABC transporter substrate-binding protein [Ruminiclostridium sp.]